MRKTDINKYNTAANETGTKGETGRVATSVSKSVWLMICKFLKTFLFILIIAGAIVLGTVISFIVSLRNDAVIELSNTNISLKYTSFVYALDENGNDTEYMSFYSYENRVWVDYQDIPEHMINAIIAIEDKRFYEHHGVDWRRTAGAIVGLLTGDSYGGSTITQQLIKNITGEDDVSLTRKIKEIFSALNLEEKYSKQQILESYLNIVNFGSGCNGVQAAANLYFDKDIQDCSIAECAAIAGITQNPSRYTPLIFPEYNKERRETVLFEMYDQGKITKEEYDDAMEESANMTFAGASDEEDEQESDTAVWDWYTDALFEKVLADLMETYGYSEEIATMQIYQGGITIHSAMDMRIQKIAESIYTDPEYQPSDEEILSGFYMMDYSGRVLATVGSFEEKEGNRLFSYAVDAARQSGSVIKPVSIYAPAIDSGMINYSTILKDEPLPNYFPDGSPGPGNAGGTYTGEMTVMEAIAVSQNAPAAQLSNQMTPLYSYNFLTEKLNFTHLDPAEDSESISAMALGGVHGGITVEEMTAAFQIFGNGGVYHEPYMYFYVEDHDGNVILDNRDKSGEQVISSETATIMQKLLRNVVYSTNPWGTATDLGIPYEWDAFGKTGTTDINDNSWFIAGTPYGVAGIWTGYDLPETLSSTQHPKRLWLAIMEQVLEGVNWDDYAYVLDSDVVSATFCMETGLLAGTHCTETATGWYARDKLPTTCTDGHETSSELSSGLDSALESSEASSEISSALEPTPTPEPPSSSSSEPSSSSDISSDPTITPAPTDPDEPSSEEPVDPEPEPDPGDDGESHQAP